MGVDTTLRPVALVLVLLNKLHFLLPGLVHPNLQNFPSQPTRPRDRVHVARQQLGRDRSPLLQGVRGDGAARGIVDLGSDHAIPVPQLGRHQVLLQGISELGTFEDLLVLVVRLDKVGVEGRHSLLGPIVKSQGELGLLLAAELGDVGAGPGQDTRGLYDWRVDSNLRGGGLISGRPRVG